MGPFRPSVQTTLLHQPHVCVRGCRIPLLELIIQFLQALHILFMDRIDRGGINAFHRYL